MATIILKHSTVKDKLPSSAQFGEVFVNYNNENPFLATLNNQGQFEKFLSENKTKELFYTKSQVNDIITNLESGGTIEFDDYYKKNEVDTLLQGKSDISHTHSYTALTDLPDLSIYLTEHQSLENYYTKSEADGKFLTTHQDLSGYALKSDLDDYLTIASASTIYATKEELEEHIPTVDAYTKAETDALLAGKANSAHTHDYETLTNKPDLSNFATKGEIPDTNGFATKQELENYQMKSGMTSYLTIAQAEQDLQPKGDYALKSELPDLTDYALKSELPSLDGYATEAELANYQPQSAMTGYSTTAHTHDYSEILNTPDVPKIWKGTLAEYTNLTEIDSDTLYVITDESEQFVTSGDVESMISGFTNLTEVQTLLEDYSTTSHTHSYTALTDLPDLSIYLTEHQDISGLATKQELANYMPNSGMTSYLTVASAESTYQPKGTYVVPSDLNDYALKSEIPSIEGLATEAELANYQPVSAMTNYSQTGHTHSYNDLEDKPTIPSIEGLATEAELANYQPISGMSGYSQTGHTHSYNDLEDKPTIPSIEGLATEAELANYQPVSAMSEYSTTAHTHSNYAEKSELTNYQPVSGMSDYALASQIPSVAGLASETWVGQNFQPQSGMSEYSTTGHTHSQYLTQTSADSRYARVVSCTQAEYDALVQNDQVEQGVLYCITESNS